MPSLETRERAQTRDGLLDEIVLNLRKVIEDLEELKDTPGAGSRDLSLALTHAEDAELRLKRHGHKGRFSS